MSNRIGDNLVHFGGNEPLVRALDEAGVRFMVIGGLAMAWHCPERDADDMDLLLDPTPENSPKVAKALTSLGLSDVQETAFALLGLQAPLKNARFYAELLTPKEGGMTYAEVEADAADARLFHIPVSLASVAALRRMKSHAVESTAGIERQKHLDDVKRLEGVAQ
ncbi:hypothetical protein J7E70_25560 [Variovorax paradoxus]|nr:hypothetical protein [Variovorax paradoxus]MBT2303816.1 hypothetical protein [Variovorax paradoxus]